MVLRELNRQPEAETCHYRWKHQMPWILKAFLSNISLIFLHLSCQLFWIQKPMLPRQLSTPGMPLSTAYGCLKKGNLIKSPSCLCLDFGQGWGKKPSSLKGYSSERARGGGKAVTSGKHSKEETQDVKALSQTDHNPLQMTSTHRQDPLNTTSTQKNEARSWI